MKRQQRVVWSKGMFLMPQHFQAQGQFIEDELQFRLSTMRFASWGMVNLEIDEGDIANQSFRIVRGSGIFPDGLAFEISEMSRNFKSVPKGGLDVYLAVRIREEGARNVSERADSGQRYNTAEISYVDQYDGLEESIQVAVPNLRILLGDESSDGMKVMRIARVIDEGTFKLDPEFIPPCIFVGVSSYLTKLISKQMGLLNLASISLRKPRAEQSQYLQDLSGYDIHQFWTLFVTSRALPELKHIGNITQVHPEELYVFFLRLAGALCAFSTDVGPLDFPAYDHMNLGPCFRKLSDEIETMLKSKPKTKCKPIPLFETELGTWKAPIPDSSYLRTGELYLAFRANRGSMDPIEFAEMQIEFVESGNVKISGARSFADVRDAALSGIPLHHVRRPPVGCPSPSGTEYFRVTADSGTEWDDLMDTQEAWVLALPGLEDPVIELFAVLP